MAERKALMLVESGARVRVISPQITERIRLKASQGAIEVEGHPFNANDLDGAFLVIAATSDTEVNHQVAAEAERRNLLVNVVDVPSQGNFILPSIARQGNLTIAISTSGQSPALARKLRQELERSFVPGYARLLELVSQVRQDFLAQGRHISPEAWQISLNKKLLKLVGQGEIEVAREHLAASLEKWNKAL